MTSKRAALYVTIYGVSKMTLYNGVVMVTTATHLSAVCPNTADYRR